MHPENAKIIAQLEEEIAGLDHRSEGDYPFEIFAWQTTDQGNFTIEKLLRSNGMLAQINIDEYTSFITSEINWKKYPFNDYFESSSQPNSSRRSDKNLGELHKNLLEFLKLNLSQVEVYLLKSSRHLSLFLESRTLNDLAESLEIQDAFYIIVGSTTSGDWIGIAPEMCCDGYWSGSLVSIDFQQTPVTDETLELKTRVEALAKDLESPTIEFLARQRYGNHIIKAANSRQNLFEILLSSIGFIQVYEFEGFSRRSEEVIEENCSEDLCDLDDNELAYQQDWINYHTRLVDLDKTLTSQLTGLTEYIFGISAVFHFYDIGKSPTGDWLGVKSICIAT